CTAPRHRTRAPSCTSRATEHKACVKACVRCCADALDRARRTVVTLSTHALSTMVVNGAPGRTRPPVHARAAMNKTANASALGYGAFALTLWLNSMTPAGWFDQPWNNSLLQLLTAVLGGCVLAIAGILQWRRENSLDTLLFLAFAAYWWVSALYQHTLAD